MTATKREREIRQVKGILLGLFVILVIFVCAWATAILAKDPKLNFAYLAWKYGVREFEPRFAFLLSMDRSTQQRFAGRNIEEFANRTGYELTDGSKYNGTESYRGWVQDLIQSREPGITFHWLDDKPDGRGYCVIAREGRFERFVMMKG